MVIYLWLRKYDFSQVTIVKGGPDLSNHLEIIHMYKLAGSSVHLDCLWAFLSFLTCLYNTIYNFIRFENTQNETLTVCNDWLIATILTFWDIKMCHFLL